LRNKNLKEQFETTILNLISLDHLLLDLGDEGRCSILGDLEDAIRAPAPS
jgi:hypothetical protein